MHHDLDLAAYLRLDALNSLGASPTGASFATSSGDVLEIGAFGPGTFRLRVGPNTRPDYGLLAARAQRCEVTRADDGKWSFASGDATLELTGAPLRLRLMRGQACILASTTDEDPSGRVRLPVIGRHRDATSWIATFGMASGEPLYGLGEAQGSLNRRGQIVHSQIADVPGADAGLSSKSVPFGWSPGNGAGAWGLFVHTPGRVTHGVGFAPWSHRSYSLVVDDEALDIFLVAGSDPAQVLDRYAGLTGRATGVPTWSLGLWVATSRTESVDEAASVAAGLRQQKIPCDVLVLADDALWESQTRFDFQWDVERCEDPVTAIGRLTQQGLHVCATEFPYVSVYSPSFIELAAKRYLLTDEGGAPFVFGGDHDVDATDAGGADADAVDASESRMPTSATLQESGVIDFTNPDAYAWWRDAHEPLFRAGISVMEASGGTLPMADAVALNGDRGTRLHNVYPQLYQHCVADATRKFSGRDADAWPIAARAAWAGSQRHPMQSGDPVQSDWEGLAASVRGALASGMSGIPYCGAEIGGAYGAIEPTPELVLRWLQMSVFASHLRAFAGGARAPWTRGQEFEQIARRWVEFRYRLLPYLRATIAQSCAMGLPLMRAMPLAFPYNALTRSYETQFMCGDALLVAPIVSAGGEIEVALPPGAWYDLATRQRVAGRQVIRYRAPLDRLPVFGREGYALPLGPVVQHTGEIDIDKPLASVWLFGKPAVALEGYTRVKIAVAADGATIAVGSEVQVDIFGDAGKLDTSSIE